jgi:hypothetical protein
MTSRWRRSLGHVLLYALVGFAVLVLLGLMIGGLRLAMTFRDTAILPNGMALGRQFDWSRDGRWDLFAVNGGTRLARDVELVCFNDRYVFVHSYDRSFTGFYDAETDSRVPVDYTQAMTISGLSRPGEGCDGYYTGWVGPGLLLDDGRPPFVPPCAWRNVDNETLRDRAWFERPCAPGPWPPERQ